MKKIFIGIDFSKKTFDATLINVEKPGDTVHGKFTNDRTGYRSLLRWVKSSVKPFVPREILFCGENTGIYGVPLSEWIHAKGLGIWIENAYTIKHSMGLARGKSDKVDSMRISEYAMRHSDKARLYEPKSQSIKSLRLLLSQRQNLTSLRTTLLRQVRELAEVLGKADKMVNTLLRQAEGLASKIKDMEQEYSRMMDQTMESDPEMSDNFRIVTSMRGISTMNAAALIVYSDNFKRFATSNKMACYWGVAPFGEDSGTTVHKDPHVSQFCNHKVKALITSAAINAVRFDPRMRRYYERLIGRGKDRMLALNNVKAKIIKILFQMVKNQQEYDDDYESKIVNKNIESTGDGRIAC